MPNEREVEQLIEAEIAAGDTRISLFGLGLDELPAPIRRFTGITELDLRANRLKSLPSWLGELTGLQALHVDGNLLESLPDSIGALGRLDTLDLADNPIRTLPRALTALPGLRGLSFSAANLEELPDWFALLGALRELTVTGAGRLPSTDPIGELTGLGTLRLVESGLRTVPVWLRNLLELNTLDLARNELGWLPGWLGELSRLVVLDISQNRLASLPRTMGGLNSLNYLGVSHNKKLHLPDYLGRLDRLTSLYMAGISLSTLPESVCQLTELRILDASHNHLDELPGSFGQLSRLRFLALGSNPLRTLPDTLRGLSALTYLDLGNTGIKSVPDWLGGLAELGTLVLSGNPLGQVPAALSRLTGLSTLRMDRCAVRALPDWLDQLSSLNYLDIADNHLTVLPPVLAQLGDLRILNANGNPLVSPPPEIVASGFGAIMEYLRAEREEGRTRLWRSKLVLVGQGRAGKSTLVAALDGRGFDKDRPTTEGLAVTSLPLPHPNPAADPALEDITMDLTVWDFGGQEIYHATHQFFLTSRSLFLVVWDPNQGYDNSRLRYWLETVTARAPEAPIILVATHGDQRPADLPLAELKARFPMITGAVIVDSSTRQGIEELRALISHQAAELPLMGATWPSPWASGADAVRALPEKHTSIAKVRALLEDHGVQDSAQDEVIAALAFLGDILHYPDEPRLKETVVLQPEWLNTRVARILDSQAVAARGGRLLWADVHAEWSDIDPDLRDHFLTMMDRFDISYRVFDQGAQVASIVTALLPWEKPALSALWPAWYTGRQVTVVYTPSFIPPGIPTWFITRTNRFAVHHWRTGALLADEESDSLALVEADIDTGTLSVTARGDALDRFLPLLLSELARSLRRYPGLSAKRLIRCPLPNDEGHSPHDYPYLLLLKVLLRGSDSVDCLETGVVLDVRQLLEGIDPTVAEIADLGGDVMTDRLEAVFGRRLEQIESNLLATRANTEVLRVAAAEAVAMHCPSVFVVRQTRRGLMRIRYELHVCCEHEGGWHVIPPGSPEALDAVYDLRALQDWARDLAPRAQAVAATAKAALPLISLLLAGVALNVHGNAKKDLLDARAHLPKIPGHLAALDGPAAPSEFPSAVQPASYAETDADFRELCALFAALDAADGRSNRRAYGGLSAAQDAAGRTVYLCREHAVRKSPDSGRPELPGMP